MAALQVELVATDHRVWAGEATMVVAPAIEGEIGILPGHSPVLSVLRPGSVRITPTEGPKREVRIDSGFVSVDHDRVTVVVENAQTSTPAER